MKTIKNLRWYIAVLLCCSTALNYLDRQTLSVLATTIQKELGLDRQQYSYVTFSFLATYMVMYGVGGRIVDWLGTRRGLLVFAAGWSVANMLHAFARSLSQLAICRALLGITEAANIPAGIKAVAEWFPLRERALAVGIFNAGTAIGAALAVPIVGGITLVAGWRAAFVVTGALGIVWAAFWAFFYDAPSRHPRLGAEERALILDGDRDDSAPPPVPVRRLLAMRETWGCILARVLTDPISYFLAFWIPQYLEARGFSLADMTKVGWIPFAALALGNIAMGVFPRMLIARGWGLDRARKRTMLVVSCAMLLLCQVVTRVEHPGLSLVLVALVMFGHAAWGNVTLPAEVFPKHVVATVSGLGGALGAAAGALTQLGIGKVVQAFSFRPVFLVCSVVYLIAFALVSHLVRDLGRIRILAALPHVDQGHAHQR